MAAVTALPTRLERFFVSDAPDQGTVDAIAGSFASSGGDMKPVMRTVLNTDAFKDPNNFMNKIATELVAFTKPALLAWAADDKFFPAEHARRLAAILPDARVELITGSRTWVMRDQPERTAQLVAGLARRATARQAEV